MTALRLLLPGVATVGDLDAGRAEAVQALADLYAYPLPVPDSGWVRANMVATLDGAASGADGRSGSIAVPADRVLFGVLRGLADVILVGAGTARAEAYRRPQPKPEFSERRAAAGQAPAPRLALVTRTGRPEDFPQLLTGADGALVVTSAGADLDAWRRAVGADRVLVAGEQDVDPDLAVAHLAARGLRRVLLEGGPSLLARVAGAGRLDEICLTLTPMLVAGQGPRIAVGGAAALGLRLAHLVECDGSLLGRWLVQRP